MARIVAVERHVNVAFRIHFLSGTRIFCGRLRIVRRFPAIFKTVLFQRERNRLFRNFRLRFRVARGRFDFLLSEFRFRLYLPRFLFEMAMGSRERIFFARPLLQLVLDHRLERFGTFEVSHETRLAALIVGRDQFVQFVSVVVYRQSDVVVQRSHHAGIHHDLFGGFVESRHVRVLQSLFGVQSFNGIEN